MIKLTDEQKEFVRKTIKPLLKENKFSEVIGKLQQFKGGKDILAWLVELGVDMFTGMRTIPNNVFRDSNLSKIKISDDVKSIGAFAFADCPRLVQVQFGNGITDIDDNAFNGSAIAKALLPPALESLGEGVFRNCKNLQEVYIPDSLTFIPEHTFDGCYDGVILYMNSRKELPKHLQLRIPTSEASWYKNHVQIRPQSE